MNPTDFALAHNILFSGMDNKLENLSTRDYIFHEILQEFYPNPVNIFQIGAIETFQAAWRVGSWVE